LRNLPKTAIRSEIRGQDSGVRRKRKNDERPLRNNRRGLFSFLKAQLSGGFVKSLRTDGFVKSRHSGGNRRYQFIVNGKRK
jgi:hypothetical protein